MMLTVHHLDNSRSQRILWLLEELNAPYEINYYRRDARQQAPKELLDISPLGKSPVITDGDVTLAESGAIIEYLILKYGAGRLLPPKEGDTDNLYFSHYAEGSIMPTLVQRHIFSLIPKNVPFIIRPIISMVLSRVDKEFIEPDIRKHIRMIESHLEKSKSGWFAGGNGPTAADFQMLFPLEIVVTFAPDNIPPNIKQFVDTVHARPAYKRVLERGGEYAYASL